MLSCSEFSIKKNRLIPTLFSILFLKGFFWAVPSINQTTTNAYIELSRHTQEKCTYIVKNCGILTFCHILLFSADYLIYCG